MIATKHYKITLQDGDSFTAEMLGTLSRSTIKRIFIQQGYQIKEIAEISHDESQKEEMEI